MNSGCAMNGRICTYRVSRHPHSDTMNSSGMATAWNGMMVRAMTPSRKPLPSLNGSRASA